MESKTKLFNLLSHGTGNVQGSGVAEMSAAEAWRSGVLHRFLAGTGRLSCFHFDGGDGNAEQQQSRFREEAASPELGGVSPCVFEGSTLSPRPMVCPVRCSRKLCASGTCALSKAGLTQTDSTFHCTKNSSPTPDRLEVHMSELCQKSYIMFDHSGNKKRIICHPSMLHEMSNLLPSNLSSPRSHLNHLQDLCSRAVCQLKKTMGVDVSEQKATLSLCKGGPLSDDGEYLGKSQSSLKPQIFYESLFPPQFDTAVEEERSVGSRNRGGYNCSDCLHEDTDLEALLSSDDEFSTGHSPSDGTWNDVPCSSDNDGWSCDQAETSRKRKRGVYELCNGDDTCSTATSSEFRLKDLNCHRADTSHTGSDSFGMVAAFSGGELSAFDSLFPDEVSPKSSASNDRHHVRGSGHQQSCTLSIRSPKSAKTSRKDKIKDTFRLLRGIIPGGDSMDAAFVLDETIQYVKSLQVQVKVQKLD